MKILLTGASGFIGTNAVQYFLDQGAEVLNLDIAPPLDPDHLPCWKSVDILDAPGLRKAFDDFRPDAVIHLAARAECDESTTVDEGYRMNTDGTRNVLEAIKKNQSVSRVIVVSSQFVCGPDNPPAHDESFHPVTVYGQSKVITEQLTRKADLGCAWTIVRPTNIWGPWHQRYTREFWKIAAKGLYIHPGGKPVVRCYGYVGNLVAHLDKILISPEETVNRQVFYLSDPAGDIYDWASSFCIGLRGSPARRVPRPILRLLGKMGDVIGMVTGRPFYISSSRVRSMTSDYLVPGAIEKTFNTLGPPPFSLEEGVRVTLDWLQRDRKSKSEENAR